MDRFRAMQAFVSVAEAGSFVRAARSLGVSKAVVSERVRQLEGLLRQPLFHRTTRTVRLTEIGTTLYPGYLELVKRLDDLENGLDHVAGALSGRLRIVSVVDFGITEVGPALSRFVQLNPGLSIELILDAQVVNPIDSGFDIAIHFRKVGAANVVDRQIMRMGNGYFASPAYVERCGRPTCPEDLGRHPCITYSFQPNVNPWNTHEWMVSDGERTTLVHVPSAMSTNNGHVVSQFALDGHGVAVIPLYRAAQDVEDGRLLRILPSCAPPSLPLLAIYPVAHGGTAKVQRTIDYLVHAFAPICSDTADGATRLTAGSRNPGTAGAGSGRS